VKCHARESVTYQTHLAKYIDELKHRLVQVQAMIAAVTLDSGDWRRRRPNARVKA